LKKLLTLTAIILTFTAEAQKKPKDTTTIQQDTILTGYRYIVVLDSVQYQNILNFIGQIPPSINKNGGYILSLIDGSIKPLNVFRDPIYALKPKSKPNN
jgi:hypothetical protein